MIVQPSLAGTTNSHDCSGPFLGNIPSRFVPPSMHPLRSIIAAGLRLSTELLFQNQKISKEIFLNLKFSKKFLSRTAKATGNLWQKVIFWAVWRTNCESTCWRSARKGGSILRGGMQLWVFWRPFWTWKNWFASSSVLWWMTSFDLFCRESVHRFREGCL